MKKLVFLVLILTAWSVQAGPRIDGVRVWSAPDHTRLVFDIDGPVDHRLFSLQGPDRLVVDFTGATMDKPVAVDADNHYLSGVRQAKRKDGTLRVVLDLKQAVRPKSFLLKPNERYGHRLVIDLHDAKKQPGKSASVKKSSKRDVIIAIDAGHGGKDPGATGRSGTHEKTITLQIAKRLEKSINKQKGMKAVLTRKNDRFLRLRDRIHKARDNHADLMISLHADSFPDPRARGSSIYALSVDGASAETARMLADKENAADCLFGE